MSDAYVCDCYMCDISFFYFENMWMPNNEWTMANTCNFFNGIDTIMTL